MAILRATVPALLGLLLATSAVFSATRFDPEPLLSKTVEAIQRNDVDAALGLIDEILRHEPKFRLAHLVRGDLLLARARPLRTIGDVTNGPQDRLGDLRAEALARLRAYHDKPDTTRLPRYLMQLPDEQHHAIVVDIKRSRLYLYENNGGQPRFLADYYVSSGKRGARKSREGDQKTPTGVYYVTSRMPQQKLTTFYGSGAFPINYPNDWDRRNGRRGHGIWLHGVPPETYSRPPRASDGCIVLANADLDQLAGKLQIGSTPVIISDEIEWLSLDDWRHERAALRAQIERWRRDWESREIAPYLTHYSSKFIADGKNLSAWAEQKRFASLGKEWIKVDLSGISMLRHPGDEEMVVVTFEQNYRSNNLSNRMKKRQYWIKDNGRWKIIFEGAA